MSQSFHDPYFILSESYIYGCFNKLKVVPQKSKRLWLCCLVLNFMYVFTKWKFTENLVYDDTFNRSAAKAKLPAEKLIAELKSSLCWKEATLSVIKHVWNEQVSWVCSKFLFSCMVLFDCTVLWHILQVITYSTVGHTFSGSGFHLQ